MMPSIRTRFEKEGPGENCMTKVSTVLLGSTGMVSQYVQLLLTDHPYFSLDFIAGSPQKIGTPIQELPWWIEYPRPSNPKNNVVPLDDEQTIISLAESGVQLAISTLPSQFAHDIEPLWTRHGISVFSNSSSYRCREDIPTIVPEINPELFDLHASSKHFCATNCTVLSFIFALQPLLQDKKIRDCTVLTQQALSGGGRRLIEDFEKLRRIAEPTIPGEAEKIVQEFKYLSNTNIPISVSCSRVERKDGHIAEVQVIFEEPCSMIEFKQSIEDFNSKQHLGLPSSPEQLMSIRESIDVNSDLWSNGNSSAQPDQSAYRRSHGMSVTIGDVVQVNEETIRFKGYSHNLIRGAAGGVLYLAEFAHMKGYFGS